MGRTIEREGATCPTLCAPTSSSMSPRLRSELKICSTESESLAHLSRIRQQRNDTTTLPITMANTAEDSPLATLAGITSPTAAAALGSAHVPAVVVTTRIILQRNSHSFSRRGRLVSGKITQ
jgi:hypothetical protein